MLDLSTDAHVHTAYSAGRDSVSVLVAAAEQAGLRQLILTDQAAPDSTWLPSYLATAARTAPRTELVLSMGVEVEVVGADGWVAFPNDLSGLDVVSIAATRLPMPAGLVTAEAAGAMLRAGTLSAAEVVEAYVAAVAQAVDRVSRYAPAMLARPLELLQRIGLPVAELTGAQLAPLTDQCRRNGTVAELSERYRTPLAVARLFADADVKLAPASDAVQARDVGCWLHLAEVAAALPGKAPIPG
jgi:putative hydrolase